MGGGRAQKSFFLAHIGGRGRRGGDITLENDHQIIIKVIAVRWDLQEGERQSWIGLFPFFQFGFEERFIGAVDVFDDKEAIRFQLVYTVFKETDVGTERVKTVLHDDIKVLLQAGLGPRLVDHFGVGLIAVERHNLVGTE